MPPPWLDASIFQHAGRDRDFVLYGSGRSELLSDETITGLDIVAMVATDTQENRRHRSEAWSSDVDWYFVVMPTGIALINVATNRGLFCRKRSWRFIEAFVDLPRRPKRKRRKQQEAR